MIHRSCGFACSIAFALMACGAPPSSDIPARQVSRFSLPEALREISGLATLDQHRLLAVADESATVYSIDLRTEQVEKRFELGEPVITEDFEGIAVAGNDVWLVTSEGALYRAIEGAAGAHMPRHEVFNTGLRKRCEIEGLAFDSNQFLLVCKENFRKKERKTLLIFAWQPGDRKARPYLKISLDQLGPIPRLHPSGIDVRGDRLYIIAARENTLLVLDRTGTLIHAQTLVGHPQPEGITLLADGSMVVSDEGRKQPAFISRYASTTGTD